MVALRVATLWLVVIALAIGADERPGMETLRVSVPELEIMVEPNDSAYSVGTYHRGELIAIEAQKDGWATIKPPENSFLWVDASQVEEGADGSCVVLNRASVRFAAESARMPGPPCRSLPKGAIVRLLDRPELKVGQGPKATTWKAIEPDATEVRYVRLDGLAPQESTDRPIVNNRPERQVSYEPGPAEPDLPPEVSAELVSIAANERSIKSRSLESWNLNPVRERYESLIRQYGSNASVKTTVQARLNRLNRDIESAQSARQFAQLLEAGDNRDATVSRIQQTTNTARVQTDRKFDAQGLLQASSRRYQGQKVHALIGPEGRPIGYVKIPPGVPISQYLSHKVGVRGVVHFDEGLGARLISVRDIELTEKTR